MDEPRSHILSPFDEALNSFQNEMLRMAGLAERNLSQAVQGLFERRDDLCNKTIAEDESIDQLEKQVDEDGVAILTRFQPVASDLRRIVAAMKISNNLERIADQAVNIARKARKLNQTPALSEISLLKPMSTQAMALLKDSLNAYTTADVELAAALKARDKILDQENAEVAARLVEIMGQDTKRLPEYLNLMFIARHFERVGDHATNIAEDAVYISSAKDIRHTQSRSA